MEGTEKNRIVMKLITVNYIMYKPNNTRMAVVGNAFIFSSGQY